MPRGLDHIVHAVHDLDAAGEAYTRLGFTVGARNRHPWGTHNRIVQFPGVFIELLSIGEMERIPAARPRTLSFGAFTRDFLAKGEGLSMLVLEGKGAAADAAAFRAAGIGDFDVFDFAREAKRPDGSTVKVAFSLAFAADAKAPDAGFFTCQQHYPENFWNPAFQSHANDVTGIAGVVLVAENPADHHVFLKAFAGVSDLKSTSSGITIETPRGEIQVMDPAAFALHYAVEPPDVARGMRLAAIRFAAGDIEVARAALGANASARMDKLIVAPQAAHGATLVFEPAGPQGVPQSFPVR
ncbi:MAG: VOC family protein [Alphaproteobacteria bacterium]|nr:MAG: VOC family protein [Alphaproteobacteria bacterium]